MSLTRPATASLGRPATASLRRHVAETLRIGIPLAAAQVAQMAMGVTDTVLLGTIGPGAIAAGGLGTMLVFSVLLVLQSVLASVGILVAQASGANRTHAIPELYWSGILLTLLLAGPTMLLLGSTEGLMLMLGEPAALAHDVGQFVGIMRWGVPSALLAMGLQRAFLPAIGAGWMILPVTLVAILVNIIACYGFIHGAWTLPRLGMQGAALATIVVQTFMALTLFAVTHGSPPRRALARWSRPTRRSLAAMLRLGLPIGGTSAVEAGLFFAVAILVGWLGPASLAAQQVALSIVSLAFMIPLGLAQAANVRVAYSIGAGDRVGARRAGLVAIAIGAAAEFLCATVELAAPETIVGFYLDPANADAFRIAVSLLGVAVLFQIADGIQCVAAGALRGLGDTRVPFALATIGYWIIGMPAAWLLTVPAGLGAPGAWWGLAAGLTVTATLLTRRFLQRSRQAWA